MYKQQAETHMKEFFQHTLRKYYTTKERRDAVTLSWDFMMAEVRIIHNTFAFPNTFYTYSVYFLNLIASFAYVRSDKWLENKLLNRKFYSELTVKIDFK